MAKERGLVVFGDYSGIILRKKRRKVKRQKRRGMNRREEKGGRVYSDLFTNRRFSLFLRNSNPAAATGLTDFLCTADRWGCRKSLLVAKLNLATRSK
jgi:hypothetical protein